MSIEETGEAGTTTTQVVDPVEAAAPTTREAPNLSRLATQPRPDVEVDDDPTEEARARVANAPQTAEEDDWDRVTEWLLSDTTEVITRKLKIRVGGSDEEPQMMPWVIRAIGIDVIRQAEREASGQNRAARRANEGGYDELKANLRVLVEGTVKPDLRQAAAQAGIADPAILLQRRLAFRPGLIAQLAGEVMSLSGFDADDVRAAGNS
jgi:hypothetical protein